MIYHCVKDDCRFWGEGDAVPQRCPQCGAPLVQAKEGELTGDAWSALGVFWVEQDGHEARALECFRKSAQMGSGWGTCNLGLCMEQGIGVKADPRQAVWLYQQAVEMGSLSALCNLGVCYEDGCSPTATSRASGWSGTWSRASGGCGWPPSRATP